jgi:hypothetical protein
MLVCWISVTKCYESGPLNSSLRFLVILEVGSSRSSCPLVWFLSGLPLGLQTAVVSVLLPLFLAILCPKLLPEEILIRAPVLLDESVPGDLILTYIPREIPRWRLEGGSRKRASYSEILERRWRHT